MVAHQVDGGQPGNGVASGKQRHHAAAIRPTVYIIANMHQHGFGNRPGRQVRPDVRVQSLQLGEAAVDVANGIHTAMRGEPTRRGREVDGHGLRASRRAIQVVLMKITAAPAAVVAVGTSPNTHSPASALHTRSRNLIDWVALTSVARNARLDR